MITKQELIDFERQVADLWEAGKIRAPLHLSGGNEDELINIWMDYGISDNDYVLCGHRNHYHALLKGVPKEALLAEILARPGAPCEGRARSMGFTSATHRFYSSAIVGGLTSAATGAAWSIKNNKQLVDSSSTNCARDINTTREHERDISGSLGDPPKPTTRQCVQPLSRVYSFCGDAVLDGGHFWESASYAAAWDLPITFIIEDNRRATCTPTSARYRTEAPDPRRSATESFNVGKARPIVRWYEYTPTWPHVSTGIYVQF